MERETGEKAYRVLARKYRPQNFSDLIGQEPMVRTLTNAFETGRIAQAWMLTGVRGVGKTTTARILARALNYKTATVDRPSIELSVLGEHCRAIIEGHHVDVVEMDAASHTGIDDIRDIIEQVRYRPVSARYKIYIIDEVHMLSTQAFNGLLKTLEEPPPHVKFIFATTEIRKVPITVLSRCQRFDLRRIETSVLTQHLRRISDAENVEAEESALAMIARAGEGSVRDALSILDQAFAYGGKVEAQAVRLMLGLADRTRIIDLFELIMKGEISDALREFRDQYDAGADPLIVLNELADFNHLVTRLRFTAELAEDQSLGEDERVRGLAFSQELSIRTLSRNWQMLLKGIKEVETASHPIQAAEMLLIRLAYAADLPSLEDALKSLSENSAQISSNAALAEKKNSEQHVKSLAASQYRPQSANAEITPLPTTETPSASAVEYNSSQQNPNASTTVETLAKKIETPPQKFVEDSKLEISSFTQPPIQTPQTRQDISTPAEAPIQNAVLNIRSFNDLINIADEKRELQFKIMLKEFVRLVSFEYGRIEFEQTANAPRDLSKQIAKTLKEWTGERWTIHVVDQGGGMTVAEEEKAAHGLLISDAEANHDVQAILKKFPGARIVDVRLKHDDSLEFNHAPDDGHNNELYQDDFED